MADLPLLRTILAICQKSWEPSFWEVMDSFCFSSICKFVSFKNPFATITRLSEFYLRFGRLYKQKKWFLWTMAAPQAAENHGDGWVLRDEVWGTYISIPTWAHPQNSLAAAEALSLKISSHGTSLKWSQRPSQSARE